MRAWAKSANESVPHPLICHALDTAAVAYRLYPLLLGPTVQAEMTAAFGRFGGPGGAEENARCWAAVLSGLHDLGKIAPAFQALRIDLALRSHADAPTEPALRRAAQPKGAVRVDPPHGWVTQLHLSRMLREVKAHRSMIEAIAWGLGGHHGYIPDAARRAETGAMIRDNGGRDEEQRARNLVGRLLELWKLPAWDSLPWRTENSTAEIGLAGAVGLAGLTSVSDWIASDRDNFPWVGPDIELVEYAQGTDPQAVRAVTRLDWTPWRPPENTGFTTLFPGTETEPTVPRPVQVAAERLLDGVTEPGLLVVEAPTGEGKTRLGIQAAAVLVRRLGLAGMYQGMPTRATGDQVFTELDDLVTNHQPAMRVRLLHGAADQHPRIQARIAAAGGPKRRRRPVVVADVDRDHEDEPQGAVPEWFVRNRGIIAPVGTGTIDQMLMGVIRSKHVFVRLTGLSNKVLILDEVHGYDLYMSILIDRLLHWAGRLGVPVILMSATLPTNRKNELIRVWRAGRLGLPVAKVDLVQVASSYPELTWADAGGVRTWRDIEPASGAARVSQRNGNRVIAVDLDTLPDDDDVDARADWLLDEVKAALDAGQDIGIAVVHNLVRRVKATDEALHRALSRRGGRHGFGGLERITITSHLTAAERAAAEERLTARFGRAATETGPTIVIGTQVLEQGLDLSFDLMASDLAPIDSLIQRAGRIRRHEDRGTEPLFVRLVVMGATRTSKGVEFPSHTVRIYPALLLLRTWLLLAALPRAHGEQSEHRDRSGLGPSEGDRLIHCPADLRGLVDGLYAEEFDQPVPPELAAAWKKATAAAALARDDAHRADKVRVPQPVGQLVFGGLTGNPTSANQTRKKGRPDDAG
ncbi:CRISPR-associated endonuclease/helicase Cas3 [Actinoalloteichus hoggarensis]|uniref:CRISPR-associated endonuclease/helicase Cas3 n=1 Tax=Actinoalloteichus hoggarensis TaxID=1470176 RepID=A0A221W836_9PSEU|nr:CRISPR-associated endonuclease/helicase Cas3 [Actinoalloteichus hoggarensis]